MSFWTSVRTPFWGMTGGGLAGGTLGLAADKATGGGAFSQGQGKYDIDTSSQPGYPGYQPIYDPKTMEMTGQLNQRLAGNQLDRQGLDKFKQEAFRVGPSRYAQLAGAQQDALSVDARNRVAQTGASQAATTRSTLAQRGGLGGGAAERIAKSSGNNVMALGQDVSRQNSMNHMQIGMNDEQNRIQQLSMVPQMDLSAANFDLDKTKLWGQGFQYDVNNRMGANKYANDWNMHQYDSQMAAWAANQQGNATANSGKK